MYDAFRQGLQLLRRNTALNTVEVASSQRASVGEATDAGSTRARAMAGAAIASRIAFPAMSRQDPVGPSAPICFVLVPSGVRPDGHGGSVNFDGTTCGCTIAPPRRSAVLAAPSSTSGGS
jgi:hypothetical protein